MSRFIICNRLSVELPISPIVSATESRNSTLVAQVNSPVITPRVFRRLIPAEPLSGLPVQSMCSDRIFQFSSDQRF